MDLMFENALNVIPTTLLVRMQRFSKRSVQVWSTKYKTYILLDDLCVILLASKAFNYFDPEEMKFAAPLTLLGL